MPSDDSRDRLIRLEESLQRIEQRLGNVETNVSDLTAQANRWKGGFWVILSLGGITGWLITTGIGSLKNLSH